MNTSSDRDEFNNIDNFKIHRDLGWIAKGLVALIVIGFGFGVWSATLAEDVRSNTREIDQKADQVSVDAIARTLIRIESKLDGADERQRQILSSVARLEEKVTDLEEEVEGARK